MVDFKDFAQIAHEASKDRAKVKTSTPVANRGAQTAVFELDIRISNPPYIDVCQSLASETSLKSRNVEKRINAV
jgi:hypothetical protein